MQEIDPRILRVNIEVNGKIDTFEELSIVATGTKYANSNQNECEVKISNLKKEIQDYILTQTSPFNLNRTPKRLTLEAGRKSYGTSRIFVGDIINSNPSQPPDIQLSLKCLTNNFDKGNIVARSQSGQSSLSQISRQVAADLGVTLNFQAIDKQVGNYNFSGGALNQVNKLSETGLVDAYIDDGVLVVKDTNLPLSNSVRVVNSSTGMIGVPEITEQGIKVKFMLDGQTTLGGLINVTSIVNPAANGSYIIYKLNFEIANRDTPFYWIAEAKRTLQIS